MTLHPDLPEILDRALAHHRSGRLAEAGRLYRDILSRNVGHFDAAHLLGIVAGQSGDHAEAERWFAAATRIDPASEAAHLNHAVALASLGRLDAALLSCEAALALRPGHVEALYNRGNVLLALGRPAAALQSYEGALALQPDHVEALGNRGNALFALRRLGEARASFAAAVALRPHDPGPRSNLGHVLLALKLPADALAALDAALALAPGHVEARVHRGNALLALHRPGAARLDYEIALALAPDHAEAWSNRSGGLLDQRRYGDALASARAALALAPGHAGALNNRGVALTRLKRPREAAASFRKALAIAPADAGTWTNHGAALAKLDRLGDAAAAHAVALAIAPGHADALYNLGNALAPLQRHAEAMACYEAALGIDPGFAAAHSNKILLMDLMPGFGFAEQQAVRRAWSDRHARYLADRSDGHANARDPERRLVIGYVSADFRKHSAASVFGPVLRRHDRSRFELVLYSNGEDEDETTAGFRRLADRWRPVAGLSDDALAERIRADRVDILVDLSGHTEGNRLLAFARKPAPIQATAWGHSTGTGIPAMDYLLSDAVSVPAAVRGLFVETVVELPASTTFEAPSYAPDVGPSPGAAGRVTFGCLNRFNKVTPPVLTLWAGILRAVPGARLLLKDRLLEDPAIRALALGTLAAQGIGAERVELRGGSPHRDHLLAYGEVDIALDPFPQNGGVSTWEALWMGCPVVAGLGRGIPGRGGAAILTSVGLADWIAASDDDYLALAVAKAGDGAGLARLRPRLRAMVLASAAGNPDAYTRAAEAAFRDVWRRWCRA